MRGLTHHIALISGFLLVQHSAGAQERTPGPVTSAFRADAERLARDLVAAADDMPATVAKEGDGSSEHRDPQAAGAWREKPEHVRRCELRIMR